MEKLIAFLDSSPLCSIEGGLVHALLEASDKPLLVLDEGLRIQGLSRGSRSLISLVEGTSPCLWDVFYPDDQDISTACVQRLGRKEKLSLSPGSFRLRDGRLGRGRLSIGRIKEPEACGFAFLAEIELSASVLSFLGRTTPSLNIDTIADPALVIEAKSRSIRGVNEGYCRTFGWESRDLVGLSTLGIHENGQAWKDFAKFYSSQEEAQGIYWGFWRFRSRSGILIPCHVLMLRLVGRREEENLILSILVKDDAARASQGQERPRQGTRPALSQASPIYSADLTNRQGQIVMLLAKGLSSKEIGRILGITESTVKNHLSQLYRRFRCPSRISLLQRLKAFSLE